MEHGKLAKRLEKKYGENFWQKMYKHYGEDNVPVAQMKRDIEEQFQLYKKNCLTEGELAFHIKYIHKRLAKLAQRAKTLRKTPLNEDAPQSKMQS